MRVFDAQERALPGQACRFTSRDGAGDHSGTTSKLRSAQSCQVCGNLQVGTSGQLGLTKEEWVYIVTSKGNDAFDCPWRAYSPKRNEWRVLPQMPGCDLATRLIDFATCVVNGQLYVLGGQYKLHTLGSEGGAATSLTKVTRPVNNVRIFDPRTNQWSFGPAMRLSRRSFACASFDGRIYIAGGFGRDDAPTQSAEVFDSRTGTWESIASLSSGRTFSSGVFLGGRFLVMGGYKTGRQEWGTPEVEEYQPRTDTWRQLRGLRFDEQVGPMTVLGKSLVVSTSKLKRGSFQREPVLEIWREEQEGRWRKEGGTLIPHLSFSGGSFGPPVYPSGPGKGDALPVLQDAGLVAVDGKVYLVAGTASVFESYNKKDLDMFMVWDPKERDRHSAWQFVEGGGNLGGKVLGCDLLTLS